MRKKYLNLVGEKSWECLESLDEEEVSEVSSGVVGKLQNKMTGHKI